MMTKNTMKLVVLEQVVNLLDAMQKVICPGCEKGDPLNMAGGHNFRPHNYDCHGMELRDLAQYIRAGVMLKISREK